MNFSERDFRDCVGCFATGVTVITIKCDEEKYRGITINSFASVSLNPPLVLFSLDKAAHSYEPFINSDVFNINILSEKQQEVSEEFATPSVVDWDKIDYSLGENDSPLLTGSIAYIECEKYQEFDGGDHTIFVGRVAKLKKVSNEKPLLYFHGNYAQID